MATFYDITVPQLRKINEAAFNILTTAQSEIANGLSVTEAEVLDAHFGDMYPLRMQPILLAKFQSAPFSQLGLSSVEAPALNPGFASLSAVADFFKALNSVLDSISKDSWDAAAEKGFDVEVGGKNLHFAKLQEFYEGFAVPHCWFHLNAIYMLLRSKGFKLGKGVYVGAWANETIKNGFAPLRG